MSDIDISIERVRSITGKYPINAYHPTESQESDEARESDIQSCCNHFDESFFDLLRAGAHLDFRKYNF